MSIIFGLSNELARQVGSEVRARQLAQGPIASARFVAQEARRQNVPDVKDPREQPYAFTARVERPGPAVQAQVARQLGLPCYYSHLGPGEVVVPQPERLGLAAI